MGTKLRALYQRKKGRDLFDLAVTLKQDGVDPDRIIETFSADIGPLLARGYS